eukprot:2460455-Rhodomonas_salina.1
MVVHSVVLRKGMVVQLGTEGYSWVLRRGVAVHCVVLRTGLVVHGVLSGGTRCGTEERDGCTTGDDGERAGGVRGLHAQCGGAA